MSKSDKILVGFFTVFLFNNTLECWITVGAHRVVISYQLLWLVNANDNGATGNYFVINFSIDDHPVYPDR